MIVEIFHHQTKFKLNSSRHSILLLWHSKSSIFIFAYTFCLPKIVSKKLLFVIINIILRVRLFAYLKSKSLKILKSSLIVLSWWSHILEYNFISALFLAFINKYILHKITCIFCTLKLQALTGNLTCHLHLIAFSFPEEISRLI